MKYEVTILIGSLILGVCILVSGGIYEGIPSGSAFGVFRLNKITGEVALCTQGEGCVSQKSFHTPSN